MNVLPEDFKKTLANWFKNTQLFDFENNAYKDPSQYTNDDIAKLATTAFGRTVTEGNIIGMRTENGWVRHRADPLAAVQSDLKDVMDYLTRTDPNWR